MNEWESGDLFESHSNVIVEEISGKGENISLASLRCCSVKYKYSNFWRRPKRRNAHGQGRKKKNQRPAVCYWFPVSVSPAWVCYDSFSFFFTEGGGRWSCVSFDVGFFFLADGDFFPAHYPFTNVSLLIVTFSNKKICEQNTQNVVPVSNMMLNDE